MTFIRYVPFQQNHPYLKDVDGSRKGKVTRSILRSLPKSPQELPNRIPIQFRESLGESRCLAGREPFPGQKTSIASK